MSKQHTCVGMVRLDTNFPRFRDCGNKAKVEREGEWYCGIHDPERLEKRRAEKYQKFQNDLSLRQKQSALRNSAPDLLAALEEFEIQTCPDCEGHRVENAQGDACRKCGGAGDILTGGWPEHVRAAIKKAKGEA